MALRFREVVHHSPFSPEGFRWRMGVRALPIDDWLQHDDQRPFDLREKESLTRLHPGATFVQQVGSEAAASEVRALVDHDLKARGLSTGSERDHSLETAGLSVQEDLCLMENVDGQWVLTAGSVCFPTRWDLRSKLGRSLDDIHQPVPQYRQQLSSQVDRFFDRMNAGALAYRLNWSVVGSANRRLDAEARQAPFTMPTDPGTQLFFRVERQTLRRLSEHDAIVFGIRIHVWPLVDVVAELTPEVFARELETIPIEVSRYKNLDGLTPALSVWLRELTG
jgi:hypothetical protein